MYTVRKWERERNRERKREENYIFRWRFRGLPGVVAKPTSGAVAFASQSLTGIGNTVEFLADNKIHPTHSRPQRFIPNTGLTPYDRTRAEEHEQAQIKSKKSKLRQ